MFKMIAVMCILVNGEPVCTTYEHNSQQEFATAELCDKKAGSHFYEMMDSFIKSDIPFETVAVGCEKI